MNFSKCIVLLSLIWESCTLNPSAITKNEFGLQVYDKLAYYTFSVKQDSLKQMLLLKKHVPNLIFDWKYATENNFTKQVLYSNPEAFMRIEAVMALQKVAIELEKNGLGLKIFDAYRPYSVTKKMWEVVPDDRYAANPAKGSGHNRGAAIDLTLYYLKSGKELEMPTPFDDFTEKAHNNYMQLTPEVLKNRATLKNTMAKYGFIPLDTEWWHFYLPNAAQRFELLDLDFKTMRKISK